MITLLLLVGSLLIDKKKYFDKQENGSWKIKSAISSRVDFRYLNLIESYTALGKFDVIFCRNVLIYFFC